MRNVLLCSTALVALFAVPVLAQDHGHGPPAGHGNQQHAAPAGHAQPHQQAAPKPSAAPQGHKQAPPRPTERQQGRPQPHQAPRPDQHAQDHGRSPPQQQAQSRPEQHRDGAQRQAGNSDHGQQDRRGAQSGPQTRDQGSQDNHGQQAQNRPGHQPAPDAARGDHGRAQRQPAPDLAQIRQRAQQDRQRVTERALWKPSQPQARRGRPKPDRRPVVVTDRAYVAQLPERQRHFVDGCPPGRGCLPPGQVKQLYANSRPYDDWWRWRPAQDAAYRYDSGYVYRINPTTQAIVSYVPVLGGALAVGNPWPSSYAVQPAPDYYADYYGYYDQPYDYRYADNVLYGVDPQSNQIEQIAALLTGSDWTIGQQMPQGYGVYNVPYDYRSEYYDTPDAMYRYDDGYIYRMDPTTQLIQAAIQLLV